MVNFQMGIKIIFVDKLSTSLNRKHILVKVVNPVKIEELFKLAEFQEKRTNLYKEMKYLMISYKGRIINYEEALNKIIYPGEEIELLPLVEDG